MTGMGENHMRACDFLVVAPTFNTLTTEKFLETYIIPTASIFHITSKLVGWIHDMF